VLRSVRALHGGEYDGAAREFLGALAAMAAASGGSPRRAARLAARCVRDLPPDTPEIRVIGAALAFLWTGRPAEAEAWADRAVQAARLRRHPAEEALALVIRSDAAHRGGRFGRGLSDAREAMQRAEATGAAGLFAAGAACAARSLVRQGQPQDAAELLTRVELPSDTHPLVRASYLEACGMAEAARGRLDEALRLFLECGHRLAAHGMDGRNCVPWREHAARAYEELGEHAAARTIAGTAAGGRRARERATGLRVPDQRPQGPRPVGLTAAEQRVTELVLKGLSNLEASERLYLSKRTVDTHLNRIYRKLGIHGRPELAAAVAALEPTRLAATAPVH
jgi:ATP/maltotriose-dependent transcriptional regulator MalT